LDKASKSNAGSTPARSPIAFASEIRHHGFEQDHVVQDLHDLPAADRTTCVMSLAKAASRGSTRS
jgi:hypothetical protein